MRYVIMANGKGLRWHDFNGTPKCLLEVEGETLLARTERLVHEREPAAKIFVASSDPACETPGTCRHAPRRGSLEIDRFCYELIEDDTCFLYGDTYYTPEAIERIVEESNGPVTVFGTERCIVAVKAEDGDVMRQAVDELIWDIAAGRIKDAKGWQLHHLLEGMPLSGHEPGEHLVLITDGTRDFNEPWDWIDFSKRSVRRDAGVSDSDAQSGGEDMLFKKTKSKGSETESGRAEKSSVRPLVGLLRKEADPGQFAECLGFIAAGLGYKLRYFTPDDVDLERGRIDALVFEDGRWRRKDQDTPRIVDVDPSCLEGGARAEDLEALLEKRSFIVGGLSNISQVDLAQALAEEPAFSGYVLDTKHLGGLDDLVDMLDCHGSVVVKGDVGSEPVGPWLVVRNEDGSFLIESDEGSLELGLQAFEQYARECLLGSGRIVQEYIESRGTCGDPVSCRLHAERRGYNVWMYVGGNMRVGTGHAVNSNAAGGGHAKPDVFFEAYLPEKSDELLKTFDFLGKNVPYLYENLRGQRIAALDIITLIDAEGSVRILDVDAFPPTTYYDVESARQRMAYYLWLKRSVIGRGRKFTPMRPWEDSEDDSSGGGRDRAAVPAALPRPESDRPLVGILSPVLSARESYRCAALLASGRGIDLAYIPPRNVDLEKGTICGYMLDGLNWKRYYIRMPDIMNVTSSLCASNSLYLDLVKELENQCYLTDSPAARLSKEQLQRIMTDDPFFKRFALDTVHYTGPRTVIEFLETHETAVIKPVYSTHGSNVRRISRLPGGRYQVGMYTDEQVLDEDGLREYLLGNLPKKRHIVQEYISSRTVDGDPFDCRVQVEKDGSNEWRAAMISVRVGRGQQIISNVNQGGNIVEIEPFLKRSRPGCWEHVMDELDLLVRTLPYEIENLRGRRLMTLGFDVGIDEKGNPHVFECNSQPFTDFVISETFLLRTAHYRWLYDHVVVGGEEFEPREPWKELDL